MTDAVRVPANVDQPDKLLAGLTARQLAILSVTGLVLYAGWSATRTFVPVLAFLIVAIPIGATAALLALGQRDGLSLDRLALAALRQRLQPRYRVAAPDGVRPPPPWLAQRVTTQRDRRRAVPEISPAPLRLPAEGVTDTGLIDLGADGLAALAVASTVNFALRTSNEKEALVASFGRFLHSLTAPVQILVRAQRLDLSAQIAELREAAGGLPHPALERAAREHADYLDQLRRTTDLLRRQVVVVLREPVQSAGPAGGPGGASGLAGLVATRRASRRVGAVDEGARRSAEARLARRLGEAVELLGPAGITLTPLHPAAPRADHRCARRLLQPGLVAAAHSRPGQRRRCHHRSRHHRARRRRGVGPQRARLGRRRPRHRRRELSPRTARRVRRRR